MYGMIRFSFMIAASFCVAMLAGERAFGQVMREAPNGDLFVADSRFDAVHVLRVSSGRTMPFRDEVFARGLKQPFGIAFYPRGSSPRWIFIASGEGVLRFPYRKGDLHASGKPERLIVGIPTAHYLARDVAFSPDGDPLYFSAGSARTQIGATRLQNCEGMTVEPATGELSCIANEQEPAGYDAAKGRNLYIANCAACHQSNGEGLPGVFPPLKGSGVVNKDDASKHIQAVLNGMQGGRAGGVVYSAPMPPFAGMLSDTEIADIINFERRSWGNHGKPVTAAQVAAERLRPK